MRIFRDHLVEEFLRPFTACSLGLIALFLMGRGLMQMADFILNKSVDALSVAQLMLYSLPFMLVFILPMSTLLAALLMFRRLSMDNEILALRASGVNVAKAVKPLLLLGVVISLCTLLLADKIGAQSHYAYRLLLMRIGIENPAAALEEGMFIKKFKSFVIFIYEIDKTKLKGIRIYQPQEGRPTRTILAQKGELISVPERGIIKLKLVHGTSDEPDPKDPSKLYKLNFKTYDLPLNVTDISEKPGRKPKEMTIRELSDEIRRLGREGITATYALAAEIHNKIAIAASCFVFMLIGIPLGITTRRGDRSVSLGLGLVVLTLHWTLLVGMKAMAQKGFAPPLVLELPNLLIGGFGAYLFWRLAKR